jgi:hypothetical protein
VAANQLFKRLQEFKVYLQCGFAPATYGFQEFNFYLQCDSESVTFRLQESL